MRHDAAAFTYRLCEKHARRTAFYCWFVRCGACGAVTRKSFTQLPTARWLRRCCSRRCRCCLVLLPTTTTTTTMTATATATADASNLLCACSPAVAVASWRDVCPPSTLMACGEIVGRSTALLYDDAYATTKISTKNNSNAVRRLCVLR